MFILENPVVALIIALGVLAFFKILFYLLNYLEKTKVKSKSEKKEQPQASSDEKKDTNEKNNEKNSDKSVSSSIKSSGDNYLYDRFVTSPTTDDLCANKNKISTSFLADDEAKEIIEKKVDIKVEAVDIEKKKSQRIYEILNKYEDRDKLLDDFNSMPREMKLLILENIIKKM